MGSFRLPKGERHVSKIPNVESFCPRAIVLSGYPELKALMDL